jgi:hypothetical protein
MVSVHCKRIVLKILLVIRIVPKYNKKSSRNFQREQKPTAISLHKRNKRRISWPCSATVKRKESKRINKFW